MDPGTIVIAVGERVFRSTKQTLQHAAFFKEIFDKGSTDLLEKPIIIDRDPDAFESVLTFLRDITYKVPPLYTSELTFYGVKYKLHNIAYTADDIRHIQWNIKPTDSEFIKCMRDRIFKSSFDYSLLPVDWVRQQISLRNKRFMVCTLSSDEASILSLLDNDINKTLLFIDIVLELEQSMSKSFVSMLYYMPQKMRLCSYTTIALDVINPDPIILHIGESTFYTSMQTLHKSDFFNGMANLCFTQPLLSPIILDRRPDAFTAILRFMRLETIQVPQCYCTELDYYGIKYESRHLILTDVTKYPITFTRQYLIYIYSLENGTFTSSFDYRIIVKCKFRDRNQAEVFTGSTPSEFEYGLVTKPRGIEIHLTSFGCPNELIVPSRLLDNLVNYANIYDTLLEVKQICGESASTKK